MHFPSPAVAWRSGYGSPGYAPCSIDTDIASQTTRTRSQDHSRSSGFVQPTLPRCAWRQEPWISTARRLFRLMLGQRPSWESRCAFRHPREPRPLLTEAVEEEIVSDLQPKLLRYRMVYHRPCARCESGLREISPDDVRRGPRVVGATLRLPGSARHRFQLPA